MGSRKSNGIGTIRKRKEGQWEARYTSGFDSLTGKQIQKSVYGKSKPEVKKKLAEALLKLAQKQEQQEEQLIQSDMTFGSWLDSWLENYCARKPNTIEQYEYQIRVNIKPTLGKTQLTELRGE